MLADRDFFAERASLEDARDFKELIETFLKPAHVDFSAENNCAIASFLVGESHVVFHGYRCREN